jgi:hypothetical protein
MSCAKLRPQKQSNSFDSKFRRWLLSENELLNLNLKFELLGAYVPRYLCVGSGNCRIVALVLGSNVTIFVHLFTKMD